MTKSNNPRRTLARYLTDPVISLLAKTSVTPSMLTWFGLILALFTAWVIFRDRLILAGILILVSGYFDILDGGLARRTNQVSKFGGVLDSTFDRIAEAATLMGALCLFLFTGNESHFWLVNRETAIILAALAILCSPLISYIRSRAETMGIDCQVGVGTRSERVILFALGLLVQQLAIALIIIVVLSFVTICQRLYYVYRQLQHTR